MGDRLPSMYLWQLKYTIYPWHIHGGPVHDCHTLQLQINILWIAELSRFENWNEWDIFARCGGTTELRVVSSMPGGHIRNIPPIGSYVYLITSNLGYVSSVTSRHTADDTQFCCTPTSLENFWPVQFSNLDSSANAYKMFTVYTLPSLVLIVSAMSLMFDISDSVVCASTSHRASDVSNPRCGSVMLEIRVFLDAHL